MKIVYESEGRHFPQPSDYEYYGLGRFPYDGDNRTARGVVINPVTDGVGEVRRVEYAKWTETKDDKGNNIYGTKTTVLPVEAGMYQVTFLVSDTNKFFGGELTAPAELVIFAATPVTALDYDISGQSQIFGGNVTGVNINDIRRALKIVPKPGKSKGNLTVYYTGVGDTVYLESRTAPWTKGTYNVTFDVAEEGTDNVNHIPGGVSEFKAAKGLSAGTLTIADQLVLPATEKLRDPKLADFVLVGAEAEGPWAGTWTYNFDGTEKEISVVSRDPVTTQTESAAIKDLTSGGIITIWYAEYFDGTPKNWKQEKPPVDAGQYLVGIQVGESVGFNATPSPPNTANLIQYPLPLAINKLLLVPEDFVVHLGTASVYDTAPSYYPGNYGVSIGEWATIGKDTKLGPYTYKNKRYPISLGNKKISNINWNDWVVVTYNNEKHLNGTRDIGPSDAGTYEVRFSMKPDDDYGNANINWYTSLGVFEVGELTIQKAVPTKEDYITNIGKSLAITHAPVGTSRSTVVATTGSGATSVSVSYDTDRTLADFGIATTLTSIGAAGATYGNTTTRTTVYAIPIARNLDDHFVASPAKLAWRYVDKDGADKTPAQAVTAAGKYNVWIDIPATTEAEGLNWTAASINLGEFEVGQATPRIEDYALDEKYFIQTAYSAKQYNPTLKTGVTGSNGAAVLKYSKTALPLTSYVEKIPQEEGKYYVILSVAASTDGNYKAADLQVENEYIDDNFGPPRPEIEYGLSINPFVIKNSFDFESWLAYITDNPVDGVDVYTVKMAYELFNMPTNRVDTVSDLLKAYPNVHVNLDFSLTELGNPASINAGVTGDFAGCSSLYEITLPPELLEAGVNCFKGSENLAKIGLGNVGTGFKIGTEAFVGTSIKELRLDQNVTEIGESAFEGVTSLTVVKIVETGEAGTELQKVADLEFIRAKAFKGCIGLKGVEIPESVTVIGSEAFAGCDDLVAVRFDGETAPLWGDTTELNFAGDAFDGDLKGKYNEPTDGIGGAGLYTRHPGALVWTYQDEWGFPEEGTP
jgi:hypothetical protein